MVKHTDLFPPGLRFGPRLRGPVHVPPRGQGEEYFDADGALRMKQCAPGVTLRYQGPKGAEHGVEFESKTDGFVSTWGRVRGETFELRRVYTKEQGGWVCRFSDHCGDD